MTGRLAARSSSLRRRTLGMSGVVKLLAAARRSTEPSYLHLPSSVTRRERPRPLHSAVIRELTSSSCLALRFARPEATDTHNHARDCTYQRSRKKNNEEHRAPIKVAITRSK